MANLLQRMGPIAVVAVVFAWCCWPHISGSSGTGVGDGGGTAGLPKSLLSPTINPANDRDPFKAVKESALNLLKNQLAPAAEGTSDESAAEAKEADEGTAAHEPSLVLKGTYIQGKRRMAIIDGKVYRQGETLGQKGAKGKPWVVKAIFPDKVVVEHEGKTTVLDYASASAPSAAPEATRQVGRAEQDREVTREPPGGNAPSVTSLSELVRAIEASQKP